MKKVVTSTFLIGLAFSATSLSAQEVGIQAISAQMPTLYTTTTQPTSDVVVPVTPEVTNVNHVIERIENIKTTSLAKMKARGAQLIKERINTLNVNAAIIAKSKALTAEQKSVFEAFFGGKNIELTNLGLKIASSTDATTTKALISSIFTEHRIYGVLIPQLRLEKRIYELQTHAVKLNETFVKVQARIDEFKNKGRDVTVWQKNLDDSKTLVATSSEKLSALLIKINALQPADYGTTSKALIESVNKDVKSIAKDLQSINKKVMRPEFLRTLPKQARASSSMEVR